MCTDDKAELWLSFTLETKQQWAWADGAAMSPPSFTCLYGHTGTKFLEIFTWHFKKISILWPKRCVDERPKHIEKSTSLKLSLHPESNFSRPFLESRPWVLPTSPISGCPHSGDTTHRSYFWLLYVLYICHKTWVTQLSVRRAPSQHLIHILCVFAGNITMMPKISRRQDFQV